MLRAANHMARGLRSTLGGFASMAAIYALACAGIWVAAHLIAFVLSPLWMIPGWVTVTVAGGGFLWWVMSSQAADATRLKNLENENSRLTRIVDDQLRQIEELQDVAKELRAEAARVSSWDVEALRLAAHSSERRGNNEPQPPTQ